VETQEASTPRHVPVVHGQPPALEPVLHAQAAAPVSRRYLLHRAWLL
jgi:hypothetical protein